MGRLSTNLDMMEAKGRTSDHAYGRMLAEMGDLCCQILSARDQANAELHQAKTDAILLRRAMAKEQAGLRASQDKFAIEQQEARAQRKADHAETSRIRSELVGERASLTEATDRAKEAERKFTDFMDQMKKASAKL